MLHVQSDSMFLATPERDEAGTDADSASRFTIDECLGFAVRAPESTNA
jgi:hypothetical protein